MHNETVTNLFWGLFLIWFGVVAVFVRGDLLATVNDSTFALGTGALLIGLNLTRSLMRLRLSVLTIGLGMLLLIVFAPVVVFNIDRNQITFLPALLIIAGIALVIGALRTRNFQV